VRTRAIWRGRNTKCAEHQQLYRQRYSGDTRTWRSSDVNIFTTDNTPGKRMIMGEHGKTARVQVLTHKNRTYNRIRCVSPRQRRDGWDLSASSVWRARV
jgi:hypothetical protein